MASDRLYTPTRDKQAPWQFSLFRLMAVMTVLGIGLAVLRLGVVLFDRRMSGELHSPMSSLRSPHQGLAAAGLAPPFRPRAADMRQSDSWHCFRFSCGSPFGFALDLIRRTASQ